MSEFERVFERCAREKRAAFIPYLTAGDPDLETSVGLIDAVVEAGADILELGVPFSDPIADGPVNQRSAVRALRSGTTVAGVLELVAKVRERHDLPIVLFSYLNPLLARGIDTFARRAAASGVDGVLCLDLPPEEAASGSSGSSGGYLEAMRAAGVATVFLLAPTSTRERIRRVNEVSEGFVYYVARTGVTGDRSELPPGLVKEVRRLRRRLDLPLAVGFGLSTPEHMAAVGSVAQGVVVGSALVRLVEQHGRQAAQPLREAAGALRAGLEARGRRGRSAR